MNSAKQSPTLLAMIWLGPWLFVALWVCVGEFARNANFLRLSTESVIRSDDYLIQSYVRKYGEAPPSLNELRLYSHARGKFYQGYDAWGARFEYLRLGRVNYTFRSFGADGTQNRLDSDPDPGIFRWGQLVAHGLQYDAEAAKKETRPSVILFAGADDDARHWNAKLFLDQVSGARRLLVRNRQILNLYMLAPHDGIEEFLWVPGSSNKIVFTASGSARYADGLWVWDIVTDQTWNLLQYGEGNKGLGPAQKARGLFVALSRVEGGETPIIEAFVAPSNTVPLDPAWFFHPVNLHRFKLIGEEKFEHTLPGPEAAKERTMFNYSWMDRGTIKPDGQGDILQKAWIKLPRNGSWERAMSKWQDYAVVHSQSPLAAYAIWSLAMFYHDAAIAPNTPPKDAAVLQGYSYELSAALTRMIAAPSWMRAVGVFTSRQQ